MWKHYHYLFILWYKIDYFYDLERTSIFNFYLFYYNRANCPIVLLVFHDNPYFKNWCGDPY